MHDNFEIRNKKTKEVIILLVIDRVVWKGNHFYVAVDDKDNFKYIDFDTLRSEYKFERVKKK